MTVLFRRAIGMIFVSAVAVVVACFAVGMATFIIGSSRVWYCYIRMEDGNKNDNAGKIEEPVSVPQRK